MMATVLYVNRIYGIMLALGLGGNTFFGITLDMGSLKLQTTNMGTAVGH